MPWRKCVAFRRPDQASGSLSLTEEEDDNSALADVGDGNG
jgi:hypothetical protein